MAKDYYAIILAKAKDAKHYGVKGMKWGVRRSSAQLRSAAAQRGDSKGSSPATKNASPPGGASKSATSANEPPSAPTSETSAARYARLKGEAKAGSAPGWSDTDLKFFNARTEALSKVSKMNEQKPGWLQETTKKVLQQAAQRQMQSVTDGVADKFISGPILKALKDQKKN